MCRVKGLHGAALKNLLTEAESPAEVFKRSGKGFESLSAAQARSIAAFGAWVAVEAEIEKAKSSGVRLIRFSDPDYPAALKEIDDPPCVLYSKGALDAASLTPAVAIVGTRHPTHYGLKMAETLARDLAAAGVVIVSGMARGCDTAAHKGALAAGGRTVAVLGTGVDTVYPRENKKLYDSIAETGLLISDYALGTPPLGRNFPGRNRIISGLSSGVIVIEAPLRSGSLMTARLSLDYNREVMAVPGQVTSGKSSGTNRLIKNGACLVENAQDVIDALGLSYIPAARTGETPGLQLSDEELAVLRALRDRELNIDELMDITGMAAAKASVLLMDMELRSIIEQRPGKCFVKKI